MVSPEEVRAAYRWILGRQPESEDVVLYHTLETNSVEELRSSFLSSSEFRRLPRAEAPPRPQFRPLDWPRMNVETNASPVQLSAMMAHVEENWRRLGLSDPHWSVVTNEAFRASNIIHTEPLFYESGRSNTEAICRTAERCGVDLAAFAECMELGCGVGRLTIWLSELFERVVAVDISTTHLALARKAITAFKRRNVDLIHLDSFDALGEIPQFDIFVSIIVLQHNPPPLILAMLNTILKKLRPGGVAYFQVPTYWLNYNFQINDYLTNASPTRGIEMHLLPQYKLFDLLKENACRVLEYREDGWTGIDDMISNSVFVQKEARL